MRAAGFGPGHVCALRQLASAPDDSRESDVASAASAKSVSKKLHSCLVHAGLSQMQPLLAQCGVRSCHCLASFSQDELEELRSAVASFGKSKVQALMDLQHDLARSQAKPLTIHLPSKIF